MSKMTDEERMKRYAPLGLSEDEKRELLEYDLAIEHDEKTEYDLSPEQLKIAQKFVRTGTKAPTSFKFSERKRKENATKAGIIAEIANFLREKSQFSTKNVTITNKERQISFVIGDETYEFTLVQKRKPKK